MPNLLPYQNQMDNFLCRILNILYDLAKTSIFFVYSHLPYVSMLLQIHTLSDDIEDILLFSFKNFFLRDTQQITLHKKYWYQHDNTYTFIIHTHISLISKTNICYIQNHTLTIILQMGRLNQLSILPSCGRLFMNKIFITS